MPVDVFSCRLVAKEVLGRQLLKLYKVEAVFDAIAGHYICKLELVSTFTELLDIVKTNDVYLEIEVGPFPL